MTKYTDIIENVLNGMIHLREALRNMRTPRFAEAVGRVSVYPAS